MTQMTPQTRPKTLAEMAQTYWQGVVYGPPGCGKTVFSTVSQLNSFVFDVDQSMNSALAYRNRNGLSLANQIVWSVKTVSDFDTAKAWLLNNIKSFIGGLVVIDSATELQRIVAREMTARTKTLTPDLRGWGDIRVLMENMTVEFRYMPLHLVYTCHEMHKMDADYGREVWRPSFDGRFAHEYAKHFSWIARLIARPVPTGQKLADGSAETQVLRMLNFGPDPYVHFKDRSGVMRQWELPVLDELLSRMMMSTGVQITP